METLVKPRKSSRKKLDDVSAKPAAEPKNLSVDTYLFYVGQVDAFEDAVKTARARLKKVRDAAKNAGISLGEFDRARKTRDIESETSLASERTFAIYARWMDLPIGHQMSFIDQLSSIPKQEELAQYHERVGYSHGIMGKDRDMQAYGGSEFEQDYLRGYERAQDVFKAMFKPLEMALDNEGKEEKAKAAADAREPEPAEA